MSPWLPEAEFKQIFSKVPRLTVEVVAVDANKGVLLTKRDIEPCKGSWHMPGGTVYFGESLKRAVERISQQELGVTPVIEAMLGYVEYPSHHQNGLDSPVGIAFRVELPADYVMKSDAQWFTTIPPDMHPDQDVFLEQQGLLKRDANSSVFSHQN